MLLADTNIWLEIILEQERSEEAKRFLNSVDPETLAITELSLDSIGIILIRLKKADAFEKFLADTIEDSPILKIRLTPAELRLVIKAHQNFNLDFEDAYQYVAAKKYGFTLVSFDSDFDRTDRGRKSPNQITK